MPLYSQWRRTLSLWFTKGVATFSPLWYCGSHQPREFCGCKPCVARTWKPLFRKDIWAVYWEHLLQAGSLSESLRNLVLLEVLVMKNARLSCFLKRIILSGISICKMGKLDDIYSNSVLLCSCSRGWTHFFKLLIIPSMYFCLPKETLFGFSVLTDDKSNCHLAVDLPSDGMIIVHLVHDTVEIKILMQYIECRARILLFLSLISAMPTLVRI